MLTLQSWLVWALTDQVGVLLRDIRDLITLSFRGTQECDGEAGEESGWAVSISYVDRAFFSGVACA